MIKSNIKNPRCLRTIQMDRSEAFVIFLSTYHESSHKNPMGNPPCLFHIHIFQWLCLWFFLVGTCSDCFFPMGFQGFPMFHQQIVPCFVPIWHRPYMVSFFMVSPMVFRPNGLAPPCRTGRWRSTTVSSKRGPGTRASTSAWTARWPRDGRGGDSPGRFADGELEEWWKVGWNMVKDGTKYGELNVKYGEIWWIELYDYINMEVFLKLSGALQGMDHSPSSGPF